MKFDIQEIKDYINNNPDSKVIIGSDSQKVSNKRKKKTYRESRFVTCVIIYKRDKNKIFFEVSKEKDTDSNPGKPFNRMLLETQKILDITLLLMDVLEGRDYEIHLDISPKKENGSNCALSAAIGWVWGTVGVKPICKPDSWASSVVSDHIVKTHRDVLNYQ